MSGEELTGDEVLRHLGLPDHWEFREMIKIARDLNRAFRENTIVKPLVRVDQNAKNNMVTVVFSKDAAVKFTELLDYADLDKVFLQYQQLVSVIRDNIDRISTTPGEKLQIIREAVNKIGARE